MLPGLGPPEQPAALTGSLQQQSPPGPEQRNRRVLKDLTDVVSVNIFSSSFATVSRRYIQEKVQRHLMQRGPEGKKQEVDATQIFLSSSSRHRFLKTDEEENFNLFPEASLTYLKNIKPQ